MRSRQPLLLRADWLAPMDRPVSDPVIRDGGAVVCGGSILAAGPVGGLRQRFPSAAVHDFGRAVLLPGLVNAHTHLELSHLTPEQVGSRPARFVDWVIGLFRQMGLQASAGPDAEARTVHDAVRAGVAQCLRFGVTTAGDISRHHALTRPLLRASPLGVVSFGEVTAMAQRRGLLEPRLAAAADVSQAGHVGARLRVGVSPHAPYSVEPEGYRRCLAVAEGRRLPLATHLAETADEAQFLRDHDGPLRELWSFLNAWDDAVPRFAGGPIRLMDALGLLDHATLFAHVNYCDDEELALLAAAAARRGPQSPTVVYCPRTHAWFGHPPHRWREMLSAGINVAVGTDSCASSPDLNLVDDLRLMHRLAPEVPPVLLWETATVRAARALGMAGEVGALSPAMAADFAAFPVTSDTPLREVLEAEALPREVWVAGERVTS